MVFAGEHGRGLPARSRQGLSPAACDQQSPTEVSPLLEPELRSCWSQGIPVQAPGEQELGDIPWGALGPSRAIPHLRLAPGCPWQDRAAGSIHTAAFPESVPAFLTLCIPQPSGAGQDGAGVACPDLCSHEPRSWIVASTGHNGSIYRGQYGRL